MRLPDQSQPVQRRLLAVGAHSSDVGQPPMTPVSAFVDAGCIAPSGWQDCYDLPDSGAVETCLAAFRDY
jgi:hypothetical protein